MERWEGKVAVVTGASSGIGAVISEELVKKGMKVVGIARRKELIEENAKNLDGKLFAVKADISKEEDILKAFSWITSNVGPIHVLINNAAIGYPGDLLNGVTKNWRDMLDTNVFGLCVATREAIKIMQANNIDGHVVNMNSEVGHQHHYIPQLNVYPASKHAVTALTHTFRNELNAIGSKIKISSISPGLVLTPKLEQEARNNWGLEHYFGNGGFLYPKDVCDAVCYVLSSPPHVQVTNAIKSVIGNNFQIHEVEIRPFYFGKPLE